MWSIGFGGSAGGFRGTSLAVLNDSFWLQAKNWGHTTERWRKRGNASAYLCVVDRSRGKGQPDTNTPYFHHSDVVFLVFFDTSLLQEILFSSSICIAVCFFLFCLQNALGGVFFINPFFFFSKIASRWTEFASHPFYFLICFWLFAPCFANVSPSFFFLFFFLFNTKKQTKKRQTNKKNEFCFGMPEWAKLLCDLWKSYINGYLMELLLDVLLICVNSQIKLYFKNPMLIFFSCLCFTVHIILQL